MDIAVSSVVSGILKSYTAKIPTGGTIMLILVTGFIITLAAKKTQRQRHTGRIAAVKAGT